MTRVLTDRERQQLDHLADLIARSPHNLVARGQRATVRHTHIVECIALRPLLGLAGGQAWIDVGTGGGLPGLVLAILEPAVQWTLLDSTTKKTDAVGAFVQQLHLRNVVVASGRAEVLAHETAYRERFDGAISRAVAALPTLVELCRGFVAEGGTVAAVKGPRWEQEAADAATARQALRLGPVHSTEVSSVPRATWLVTMTAVGPTPPAYPRREGRPRSQPLGGRRR